MYERFPSHDMKRLISDFFTPAILNCFGFYCKDKTHLDAPVNGGYACLLCGGQAVRAFGKPRAAICGGETVQVHTRIGLRRFVQILDIRSCDNRQDLTDRRCVRLRIC